MKETDLLTFKRITIMKKQYILPSTTSVLMQSGLVCQVTSIRGNGPDFGGENSSIDPG